MSRIAKPLLVCGIALAIAAGTGLAWYMLRASDVAAPVAESSGKADAGNAAGMGGYTDMWSKDGSRQQPVPDQSGATTAGKSKMEAGMNAMRDMRHKAQTDPAALQELIQRFNKERDPQAREMLKATLATINQPEVTALAKRLATSKDAGQRRDGLDLLQRLPADSADVRKVVRQILASEQSTTILTQALGALKPAAVDAAEGREIITQLESLSHNPDAGVRRQSIFRLGQWARNGEASARLTEALQDQSPEVKQAAILALGQSHARPDSAKTALLAVMSNPSESRQIRDSAVQALDRFQLTPEEMEALRQVRMQLHGY